MENYNRLEQISKWSKWFLLPIIIFAIFFSNTAFTFAKGFGVSPAEVAGTVVQGDVFQGKFNVSRGDATEEKSFQITSSNKNISFSQEVYTIPVGNTSVDIDFSYNSENIDIGEYEIDFVISPVNDETEVVARGIVVLFKVKTKATIKVISKDEYKKILNIEPPYIERITINGGGQFVGDKVFIVPEIKNRSVVKMDDMNVLVEIFDSQGVKVSEKLFESVSFPAGITKRLEWSVVNKKAGGYSVKTSLVADGSVISEKTNGFSVVKKPFPVVPVFSGLILVTIIVAGRLIYRINKS